jgi:hypothetical protein
MRRALGDRLSAGAGLSEEGLGGFDKFLQSVSFLQKAYESCLKPTRSLPSGRRITAST